MFSSQQGSYCQSDGVTRGGFHWIDALGVAFEVYPMYGLVQGGHVEISHNATWQVAGKARFDTENYTK